MAGRFEIGSLLGHVHTLRDGSSIRLRLARSSDAPAVQELLGSSATPPADLEIARLVHFDPRRQYVLCATGLVDSSETLLGLGVIGLDGSAEPELIVVADGHSDEIGELLRRALRASARGRSRAA